LLSIRHAFITVVVTRLQAPQDGHTPTPNSVLLFLDLEAETSHAAPVLVYRRLASGLGISSLGEEHALVALGLLIFADAAGLLVVSKTLN